MWPERTPTCVKLRKCCVECASTSIMAKLMWQIPLARPSWFFEDENRPSGQSWYSTPLPHTMLVLSNCLPHCHPTLRGVGAGERIIQDLRVKSKVSHAVWPGLVFKCSANASVCGQGLLKEQNSRQCESCCMYPGLNLMGENQPWRQWMLSAFFPDLGGWPPINMLPEKLAVDVASHAPRAVKGSRIAFAKSSRANVAPERVTWRYV